MAMTMTIASIIAQRHFDADVAQLARGETLDLGGPIAYRTGCCDIDQDVRFERPDLVCSIADILDIEAEVVAAYDRMADGFNSVVASDDTAPCEICDDDTATECEVCAMWLCADCMAAPEHAELHHDIEAAMRAVCS